MNGNVLQLDSSCKVYQGTGDCGAMFSGKKKMKYVLPTVVFFKSKVRFLRMFCIKERED